MSVYTLERVPYEIQREEWFSDIRRRIAEAMFEADTADDLAKVRHVAELLGMTEITFAGHTYRLSAALHACKALIDSRVDPERD